MIHVKHKEYIHSYVGKSDFHTWASIVQHSCLVVGNDSATMHIAAAARIPAVCIAGVYDKYQFFPYKVDILENGDSLPITVLKDMDCAWCRTKGYYAGYQNKACAKQIKGGGCALCIDVISVQDVWMHIDSILSEVK